MRLLVIIDTVCAVRPVRRAISAPGSAPCSRTACSTTRSLYWRRPTWLDPRGRRWARSGRAGEAFTMASMGEGVGGQVFGTQRAGHHGHVVANADLLRVQHGRALAEPRDVDAVGDLEHV